VGDNNGHGGGMICHQKVIRDRKAIEDGNGDLFGKWWLSVDTDIKKSIVKEISYKEASSIILEYEWLGTMPSQVFVSYGIFHESFCVGAVCFSDVRQQTKMSFLKMPSCILARGACVHWAHKHCASKLISSSCKMLDWGKYAFVIAYSDPEAGEIGTVYQACNWVCVGKSQKMRWTAPNGVTRSAYHHRNISCTNSPVINGKRTTDKLLAEKIKQELLSNGWKWELGPSRVRYALALGKGKILKERRKMLDEIRCEYPKRKEIQVP
jgi:hypothetical protein